MTVQQVCAFTVQTVREPGRNITGINKDGLGKGSGKPYRRETLPFLERVKIWQKMRLCRNVNLKKNG